MTPINSAETSVIKDTLKAYPSSCHFQALTKVTEQILTITRSLGNKAKLGLTGLGQYKPAQ